MGIVCDALTTRASDKIATTVLKNHDRNGFYKDYFGKRFSDIIIGNAFQQQDMLDFFMTGAEGLIYLHDASGIDVGLKTTYGEEWFPVAYYMKSINKTNQSGVINLYVRRENKHRVELMFYNVYDSKGGYMQAVYKNNIEKECIIHDYRNFSKNSEERKTYYYNYNKNHKFGFLAKIPCDATAYISRISDNDEIESFSYELPGIIDIDIYPKGTIFVPDGKDKTTVLSSWIRAYKDIYDRKFY